MLKKISIISAIVLGSILVLLSGATGMLYLAHSGDYSVPATTADDPSLPRVVLDGYAFHAEIFGTSGDPLIIALHGGPGMDYRYILPLKELTTDGYRVLFYDQRGSGLSPRVEADELTLDRYIADLDLFIDEYSTDGPVILIGHSWGAMLASAYIGVHPEKVSRMVLAEPGMLDDEHMKIFYETTGLKNLRPSFPIMAALTTAWAESLHIDGPDDQARRDYLMNAFFTTPMKENPLSGYYPESDMENAAGEYWRFGSLVSSTMAENGLDDEGRLMNLAAGGPEWSKTGRALFISGSENRIIGPDYQRTQMHYYPGSELVVIQDAGHTMFGEKPAESLAAIRNFLAGDGDF